MKTLIAAAFAVLMVMPTNGYASSIGEQFTKKFLSGTSGGAQWDHQPVRLECTNFQGKWKMKCQSSGSDLEIQQGNCEVIKVGSEAFFVGGLSGRSEYVPSMNTAVHTQFGMAADWDEKKESFFVRLGGLITTASKENGKAKNGIIPLSGQVTYSLVNNQLKGHVSLHYGEKTYEEDCIGEKQN